MAEIENVSEKRYAGLTAYAPLFLWIGFIFFWSSGQGSMPETSRFIRPLLEFLFPLASEETLIFYHGCIRKAAHFTEYAILAFLAFRAFSRSSRVTMQKFRYILPLLIVITVAAIDEFNQSFDESRTGSVWDVLLDISGGTAMILLLWASRQQKPARK